jgi:3-oxoacyl-[acyl-carrier-protein] synthase-3
MEAGFQPAEESPRVMGLARIEAIASHLPDAVLDNAALAALYPDWPADKILNKTGIAQRRIAASGETSADLAQAAAEKLFAAGIDPASIDYLLFCTQTPDYVLPTTACVLQDKLGLRTDIGALDFNLGCSGFVYGLSLAKGLIETGQARRVLLLTADTYSKLIHPLDKSVRTLFGDGAAATLVGECEADAPQIGPFVFGTDGSGAQNLIVPAGGYRTPRSDETALAGADDSGNMRSADHLYMNGAAIMAFTLREVPAAVARLQAITGVALADYDVVAFHQANGFMLERLRAKLGVDPAKFALRLERCGNTVSSTIPIALEPLIGGPQSRRALLVGFGVGYSWAACQAVLPSQGDLQ